MSTAITLTPVIPPAPLVLVDDKFVSTLVGVEKQLQAITINSPAEAQVAADLQIRLTNAGKDLENTRLALVRPYIDAQNQINGAAKPVGIRIESAKTILKDHLSSWRFRQEEIAKAAERARQMELARLEAKRRQEEQEAKDKAAAIAKAAADAETFRLAKLTAEQKAREAEFDFEDVPDEVPPAEPPEKTETEKAIDAVKFAPVAVTAKPVGITYRVTLKAKVVDVFKLPEIFVKREAKETAIRQAFCVGWKENDPIPACEGIEFTVDKQPIASNYEKF